MISGFTTVRNGEFMGAGDTPPWRVLLGEHAPKSSPLAYAPAFPELAMLGDPAWFYHDWRESFAAAEWTQTLTGAGSSIARTTDKALLMTCDAADNDACRLQHLFTFTPAADRFASCVVRFRVSEATQIDAYHGWYATDTDPVGSEPADSAFFKKDDGDTILNGRTNDAGGTGSETANLLTNFAAATDYDFGVTLLPTSATLGTAIFHYKLASSNVWSQVTKTTDFPDAAVRFSMLVQNGDANARTMTVKRWAFWCYQP